MSRFTAFRHLRHLRRYVTDICLCSLVVSVACAFNTRLRQLRPDRASCLSTAAPPVCSQRCGLVFRLRRYDHVTDALATLHWLRLPQHVDFKVAVMTFLVLHGLAPLYLNQLVRVADLPSRRRLRSASSHQLLVPSFRLTTVILLAQPAG